MLTRFLDFLQPTKQMFTGYPQVFPAITMEEGCKNHKETLYSSKGKIVYLVGKPYNYNSLNHTQGSQSNKLYVQLKTPKDWLGLDALMQRRTKMAIDKYQPPSFANNIQSHSIARIGSSPSKPQQAQWCFRAKYLSCFSQFQLRVTIYSADNNLPTPKSVHYIN